jgi:hypothetical protein
MSDVTTTEDLTEDELNEEEPWEDEIDGETEVVGVYDDPIPLAGIFQDRGLVLEKKMRFDEWARLGPNLLRMEEGHQFWLGDWFGYGEDAWGEDVFQVIDPDRFEIKTLNNYRWVSAQIPFKERHAGLKWSHHRIAAELPTITLRRKVLKRAVAEQLTTRQLQQIVDELKPEDETGSKRRTKSTHTWSLSFTLAADDEATGDSIHDALQDTLTNLLANYGVEATKTTPSKS